ncbi:MAG: hypothetical protein LBL45_06700 [Treponema sp.]|nr:hypothetical protein [Treponema sp.]
MTGVFSGGRDFGFRFAGFFSLFLLGMVTPTFADGACGNPYWIPRGVRWRAADIHGMRNWANFSTKIYNKTLLTILSETIYTKNMPIKTAIYKKTIPLFDEKIDNCPLETSDIYYQIIDRTSVGILKPAHSRKDGLLFTGNSLYWLK